MSDTNANPEQTVSESRVVDLSSVSIRREKFPLPKDAAPLDRPHFAEMFRDHGMEVRRRPMILFFSRYAALQQERRLVWIVARFAGVPIGYSCHFTFQDLHFAEKVAADDIWYVKPEFRERGIGKAVKLMGHVELKKMGAVRTYDLIRYDSPHHVMTSSGFKEWGTRWVKDL